MRQSVAPSMAAALAGLAFEKGPLFDEFGPVAAYQGSDDWRKLTLIRRWGAFSLAGHVGHAIRLVYLVNVGTAPRLVRKLLTHGAPVDVLRAVVREAWTLNSTDMQEEFADHELRQLFELVREPSGAHQVLTLYRGGLGDPEIVRNGFSWTFSLHHAKFMAAQGVRDLCPELRGVPPSQEVVLRASIPSDSVAFVSWHSLEEEVVLWKSPDAAEQVDQS